MANEPITRQEMLLNAVATGEVANLEPITREEMFLAKLGGADVNVPTPITRKEQFLQKAIEGSGGSGGSTDEWIGDGNTHIWITLHEGRTSPMLWLKVKGTVMVDWGDGTDPDILTGTSLNTDIFTPPHNYANPGDYVVTLKVVDGEASIRGSNAGNLGLFRANTTPSSLVNYVYLGTPQAIEIGENLSVPKNAFYGLHSLEKVFIPSSVASINTNAFYGCYSLSKVILSEGIKSIGNSAFYHGYGISTVIMPSSIETIEYNAFYCSYGLKLLDFTKHTFVPTLASSTTFPSINVVDELEIRVPAALYDEWIAATNWSTYASQIVAV